jgi:hypothetical protein
LWGSLERFGELYEARRRYYLKASFRQETDGKTIQEIATEVVEALGLNRRREKRGEK